MTLTQFLFRITAAAISFATVAFIFAIVFYFGAIAGSRNAEDQLYAAQQEINLLNSKNNQIVESMHEVCKAGDVFSFEGSDYFCVPLDQPETPSNNATATAGGEYSL